MAMAYDVGDTVRVWGIFRAATFSVTAGVPSASYALADPTAVELVLETPSGDQTTYTYEDDEVTRHSEGAYYVDVSIEEAGTHAYRWSATGAVAAAAEGRIVVVARITAAP